MLSASNHHEPSRPASTPTPVWTRRLLILLTILAATALVAVILWSAGHVITSLLIVLVAALIAYAIVPVVELFHRVMPRALAILLAYLIVLIILGAVLYYVVSTAVFQISILVHSARVWLTPGKSGNSPLVDLLLKVGLTQVQVKAIRRTLYTCAIHVLIRPGSYPSAAL